MEGGYTGVHHWHQGVHIRKESKSAVTPIQLARYFCVCMNLLSTLDFTLDPRLLDTLMF